MNKASGAPKNDKSIFAAVTSLMKAQAYELGSLSQRKKSPAVYQFNLLSIADTDLVRLKFEGASITATSIDSEHYIARYIIKKRETFSRIRFLTAHAFSDCITEYGTLHADNCRWFALEYDSFYRNVVTDNKRVAALLDDFRKEVSWHVRWPLLRLGRTAPDDSSIGMYWNTTKKMLEIYTSVDTESTYVIREDKHAIKSIGAALKKVYRYDGPFEIDDNEIPF